MLKTFSFKEVYDSEVDNILEDFYVPALQHSVKYDRAVGYFDAKVLVAAARGLSCFVNNGGYVRLIVGATLKDEEYLAISDGYSARELLAQLSSELENDLQAYDCDLLGNQLNTLTWLIQHGKMDVKIALRRGGIYHEKIGIFEDEFGDKLIFQGSANETTSALTPYNFESINVFKGWRVEFQGHIAPHIEKFERLWADGAKNTKVVSIKEELADILSRHVAEPSKPSISREIEMWQKFFEDEEKAENGTHGPKIPTELWGQTFDLKDHQRNALNSWRKNKFRGILELATGAGKTITAIYGALRIYEARGKLCFVVSAPYQSLADQWAENLKLFDIHPLVCYGGEGKWKATLQSKILDYQLGVSQFIAVVVVDATLSSASGTFRQLIGSIEDEENFLFVGDECHHHGAEITNDALPINAGMRMGLSATPQRSADQDNERLTEYYGEVVAEYTMKDALDEGVLTPYDYHLVKVSLNDHETEKYIGLTKKISKLVAMQSSLSTETNEALNILLSQRARIISGAADKLTQLSFLLKAMQPRKHSLFYCAEGRLDEPSSEDDQLGIKQIQLVSELLHEHGWRSSQFTANEGAQERALILDNFKNGSIHALAAMKCLDEGIDIPACETAFILASSRQPRQFIQRRGRILRKSPGKTKSVIYDFFVTLPLAGEEGEEIERRLIISELKRINEFSSLSLNKGEAFAVLSDYLEKHDLSHYLD